MEVICINDNYPIEILKFWEEHGVSHPLLGKIYTIRESIRHFDSTVGVRLEEIENPTVPINHPILGKIMFEPTFALNRFAKLNGNIVSQKEVKEIVKVKI